MGILSKTKSAIKKAATKLKTTASSAVSTVGKVIQESKGKTRTSNLSKIIPVPTKSSFATQEQAAANRNKLIQNLRSNQFLSNVRRIVAEDTLKSSSIKSGSKMLSAAAGSNKSEKLSISGKDNIIGGISRSRELSRKQVFVPTKENIAVAESLKTSLKSINRGIPISRGISALSASARSNKTNRFSISGKGNIIGGISRSRELSRKQVFVPTKENIAVARSIRTSLGNIDRTIPIYSGLRKISAAGRSIDKQRQNRFSISGKDNIIGGISRSRELSRKQVFVPTKESKEVSDALKKTSKIYAIGKGAKMIYLAAKSSGTSKDKFKLDKDILSSLRRSYINNRKQDMSPKTAEQKAVAKALGVSVNNLKTAVTDPEIQAQATVLLASSLAPTVISRTPNLYRAAKLRATGKYIPAEEIFSKQALKSELQKGPLGLSKKKGAGLTTGYTPKTTIKAFKETKGKLPYRKNQMVAVTATDFPGKIKKSELISEKLKQFVSKKGLPEDPGIYITPYGKGQTLFLRVGAKGSGYSYSLIPKVTFSKPSAYVVGFKKIGKYPRSIIKGKGFNITKEFQEKFAKGKSKPLITKRMTLGGTSEPEAVIPLGDRLYPIKTKKPLYTTIGKEVVPVYRTELRETLKNKLLYRARASGIKATSKNTTKEIINKLKQKGKYNDKLISKIKKETTDLYSMSSSGGKSILIPIPYYKLSKALSSSTSSSTSKSIGKSSSVGKSESKTSSTSSSSSKSSGKSSGGSSSGKGYSGSSGGGSSGSSSSGGDDGSSGSSSGGSSGGRSSGRSSIRKISNKKTPRSGFMFRQSKIVKPKIPKYKERAYKQIAIIKNREVEINKNKNMNLTAARNFMSKLADNRKFTKYKLIPKSSRATIIQTKLENRNRKFSNRKNTFIERKAFRKDKPLERIKGNRVWF